MRAKRKSFVKEKGFEVYSNYDLGLSISREACDNLCFEINNLKLQNFLSFDIGESVAAIMRIKNFNDKNFWSINITDKYYDVDAKKCLYWLTGGDNIWRNNNEKKYKWAWCELSEIFILQYSDIIYDIIDEAKTLNDIKIGFNKYLNSSIIYEFALEHDLLK